MGKIGDLFVKLGLKKDEYSRGMKEAGNEGKAFSDKMKQVGTAVKATWAVVGAAITKFVTDAVKLTQRWGDEWNQTMAGVKAAYSAFVRQLSSGEGWRNLFSNMREAARIAKETAAALDELGERKVSFSYTTANTEKEIAAQELIMRDSSKSSAEREAAAKRIIELERMLGEEKKSIAKQEADAMRQQFQAQTKMNDAEIDFLVRRYNENRSAIQQSRDYIAERKRLQNELDAANKSYGTGAMSDSAYKAIEQRRKDAETALANLEQNTSQYVKDIAELTKKYDQGNDELVQGMAKAEVAVIQVDTEVMHAQQRAISLLGTLKRAASMMNSGSGGGGEEAPNTPLLRAGESMDKEFERQMQAIERDIQQMNTIEFHPLEITPPDLAGWNEFYKGFKDTEVRIEEIIDSLRTAAITGFTEATQAFTNMLAGVEEANAGRVVQALLSPLADMAIKEGEIVLATGIGIEAVKEALTSLNPYAAAAAGAALLRLPLSASRCRYRT